MHILDALAQQLRPVCAESHVMGAALMYWVTATIVGIAEQDAYILTFLHTISELQADGVSTWPLWWMLLRSGTLGSNLTVSAAKATGASVTGPFVAPAPTPQVFEDPLPVACKRPEEYAELTERIAAQYLAATARAGSRACCWTARPRRCSPQHACLPVVLTGPRQGRTTDGAVSASATPALAHVPVRPGPPSPAAWRWCCPGHACP